MRYILVFIESFFKGWCIASGVAMFFFVMRDTHYRITKSIKNRRNVRRLTKEAKNLQGTKLREQV